MQLLPALHERRAFSAFASCSYEARDSRQLRQDVRRQPRLGYSSARRRTLVQSSKNFYEVLDVPRGADAKTIKKAYKKKALKFHPDVNKEADAKEVFMECKTAYQTLVDEQQRRQYDRTLDGGSGGFDWGSFGDAFKGTSGARQQSQQQRPKRQEEEFYGFNDLFRDLERGFTTGLAQVQGLFRDLEKEFQERKARQTGQPESLWQELYAIGEEFVEFLEHEASGLDKKGQARHAETTKAARDLQEELKRGAAQSQMSAEEQAKRAREEGEKAKQTAEQDIEDMLAELKKSIRSKE